MNCGDQGSPGKATRLKPGRRKSPAVRSGSDPDETATRSRGRRRRLPQGGTVDRRKARRPCHRQVNATAARRPGTSSVEGAPRRRYTLVERQRLQVGGGQVQALHHCRPPIRSHPPPPTTAGSASWWRGDDLAHRDTRQIPRECQDLRLRGGASDAARCACAPMMSRPDRTMATPAAAAATVTPRRRSPPCGRRPKPGIGQLHRRDIRPNPRAPATPIPSSSAWTVSAYRSQSD